MQALQVKLTAKPESVYQYLTFRHFLLYSRSVFTDFHKRLPVTLEFKNEKKVRQLAKYTCCFFFFLNHSAKKLNLIRKFLLKQESMRVLKSVGQPYTRCSRSKKLAQLWKTLQMPSSFITYSYSCCSYCVRGGVKLATFLLS